MLAIVTNFGRPRVFPSCKGNLWLNRMMPVEVNDPLLLKQLQNYNKRRDIHLEIKIVGEKPKAAPAPVQTHEAITKPDYSGFKVQQLRTMAAVMGISGTFKMRKKDLIEKLEEKDGK